MRWFFVLLPLTGCPGTLTGDDEPPPTDGPVAGTTNLHIAWATLPAVIPGESGDLTIEFIRFDLKNLRVIGDAGQVEIDEPRLEWDEGKVPSRIDFPDAPAGIYSRIVFEIEGHGDEQEGIEIDGTVQIESNEEDFEIRNVGTATIGFDIGIVLQPGDDLTQTILVDLAGALGTINFVALPVDGGRRILRGGDPQVGPFLTALASSFEPQGLPTTN